MISCNVSQLQAHNPRRNLRLVVHLSGPESQNHIFLAPGRFKTGRGRVQMHLFFVGSNLHVQITEANLQSKRSKHFSFFSIWVSSFASLSGRTHFRKAHTRNDHQIHVDVIRAN